jgi:hypothetical protein
VGEEVAANLRAFNLVSFNAPRKTRDNIVRTVGIPGDTETKRDAVVLACGEHKEDYDYAVA